MIIDLKAHRCPTAQVLMNRVLDMFMQQSESDELVIMSIEPSLRRNIEARLVALDIPAKVLSESSTEISNQHLMNWQDAFDEDDFGDVKVISTIKINKISGQIAHGK